MLGWQRFCFCSVSAFLSTAHHRLPTAIIPVEKSAERPLAPPQHHDDSHLPFLSRCGAQHLPGGMSLKLLTFVIVGADTFLDVYVHVFHQPSCSFAPTLSQQSPTESTPPSPHPASSAALGLGWQWCSPLAPPTAHLPFTADPCLELLHRPQIKSALLEKGDNFEACLLLVQLSTAPPDAQGCKASQVASWAAWSLSCSLFYFCEGALSTR